MTAGSSPGYPSGRILGSPVAHLLLGPLTEGPQRSVCGLTRRFVGATGEHPMCRHCLRLTSSRDILDPP
jgi:hypothetical protein